MNKQNSILLFMSLALLATAPVTNFVRHAG